MAGTGFSVLGEKAVDGVLRKGQGNTVDGVGAARVYKRFGDLCLAYEKGIHVGKFLFVNSVKTTAFRQWATSVLKQYTIKGYAINQNAVSEQKYEDLKRAVGLLENVFSQNLVLTSQQATELFDVVRDYTYVHWTPWMPMITRVWKYLTPLFKRSSELHTRVQWKQSLALRKNSEKASCSE